MKHNTCVIILLSSTIDHLGRVWESELLVLKEGTVTFRSGLETAQLQSTLPQSVSIIYCGMPLSRMASLYHVCMYSETSLI